MPVLEVFPSLYGRLTQLSMLVAFALVLSAFAALHWRGVPDEDDAHAAIEQVAEAAEAAGFVTHWGRKVLEIRPPVRIDKGAGLVNLLGETDLAAAVYVGDDVTDSQVTAVAQIASVDTGSADRDTHLKSGDFFDAEANPTMSFTSTEVTPDSLTGDLTIKGVTKPVTFDLEFTGLATDPWGNEKAGFEASADINRKDWDLSWNAALETGGVLVSEKIKLELDISAIKNA